MIASLTVHLASIPIYSGRGLVNQAISALEENAGVKDEVFRQYLSQPGSLIQGRLCGMRATPCKDKIGCLNSLQLYFALPVIIVTVIMSWS